MWLILTGSELEPHAVSAGKSRILCSEHMYEQDFLQLAGELEPHAVSAGKSRILCREHMYEQDLFATGRYGQQPYTTDRLNFQPSHQRHVYRRGAGIVVKPDPNIAFACGRAIIQLSDPDDIP